MNAAPPKNIMLVAVEPSADAIGAKLYVKLKQMYPDAHFTGCGGQAMVAAGFTGAFSIEGFAVMGFTDVAKVLPQAYKRAAQLATIAATDKTDLVVFIDGWFFSRLTAERMRKKSPPTKLVKYVAPQVWASRPQRVDFVRDNFDLVLALLPFEPPIFEAQGIACQFVGNPTFEQMRQAVKDPDGFRQRHDLGDAPILLCLPGSRKGEVKRLAPVFQQSAKQICARIENLRPVVVVASSVHELIDQSKQNWPDNTIFIPASERFDAFAAAQGAIAASGTVATELSLSNVPHIIAYKVDALTMSWAKRVMTTDFVTVLNIDAGHEIIPEFLQQDCTADLIVPCMVDLFNNDQSRQIQLKAFKTFGDKLVPPGGDTVSAAANAIAALIYPEN